MNEKEMREEIDRLRLELEIANKSREQLRAIISMFVPREPPEEIEKQLEEAMKRRGRGPGIQEIIDDLLRDEPRQDQQIPA